MFSDEMTIHALLAAAAAKEQGFHATSEAFLALVRQEMNEAREHAYSQMCLMDVSAMSAWAGG